MTRLHRPVPRPFYSADIRALIRKDAKPRSRQDGAKSCRARCACRNPVGHFPPGNVALYPVTHSVTYAVHEGSEIRATNPLVCGPLRFCVLCVSTNNATAALALIAAEGDWASADAVAFGLPLNEVLKPTCICCHGSKWRCPSRLCFKRGQTLCSATINAGETRRTESVCPLLTRVRPMWNHGVMRLCGTAVPAVILGGGPPSHDGALKPDARTRGKDVMLLAPALS